VENAVVAQFSSVLIDLVAVSKANDKVLLDKRR
jgi:hypothetical protein